MIALINGLFFKSFVFQFLWKIRSAIAIEIQLNSNQIYSIHSTVSRSLSNFKITVKYRLSIEQYLIVDLCCRAPMSLFSSKWVKLSIKKMSKNVRITVPFVLMPTRPFILIFSRNILTILWLPSNPIYTDFEGNLENHFWDNASNAI